MLPDYAGDDEEVRREKEQARTEKCTFMPACSFIISHLVPLAFSHHDWFFNVETLTFLSMPLSKF